MKTTKMKLSFRACRGISVVGLTALLTVLCLLTSVLCSFAQCTFSSGSTGADGAFIPTNSMLFGTGWSVSNNVVTVTNKPNGVFNFTTIYIETNWVVKFTRNTLNTPVYLLAQSNVTIRGTIDVTSTRPSWTTSAGGIGGPGGFDGATGVSAGLNHGAGPGAGFGDGSGAYTIPATCCGNNGTLDGWGKPYGTLDILPMIGGSGGGGQSGNPGGGGGAGGGAILIASSGTLSCDGTLDASAGAEQLAGGGSGGSIRLIANTIIGEGAIRARDGGGGSSVGRIRIEACTNRRVSLTDPLPPSARRGRCS